MSESLHHFQPEKESSITHVETEQLVSPADITLVFGQGPIKPVFLEDELNNTEIMQWEAFKKDPLHSHEPEFRVVGGRYKKRLDAIDSNPALSAEEKTSQTEQLRDESQHDPRFALHRYGRFVALAAGAALLNGDTEKLLVCGGQTMPGWAKENGKHTLSSEVSKKWPSEAELMGTLIERRYGEAYKEKFGKPISDVLLKEDSSPTTIHNLAHALDLWGPQLDMAKRIGFLSTGVHLNRVMALANLLVDAPAEKIEFNSDEILETRAVRTPIEKEGTIFQRGVAYQKMVSYTHDTVANPIAKARQEKEEQLLEELLDNRIQATWIIIDRDKPELHDTIVRIVKPQYNWVAEARPLFEKAGINFDTVTPAEIEKLRVENPDAFEQLQSDILDLNENYPSQYRKGSIGLVTKKDV